MLSIRVDGAIENAGFAMFLVEVLDRPLKEINR